jgi:hypothetical protein
MELHNNNLLICLFVTDVLSASSQPKALRVIYSTIINRTIMSGNDLQDYGRHDKSFTSKL